MSRQHGSKTVVKVGSNDLSQFTNASEFNPTTDSHDTTCYGADGHQYDPGLTNGTFTMSGVYDSTATTGPRAVLLALKGANAKETVVRQPEGTGSGKPQDSFSGLCTSYTESNPVADYIAWSASFQIDGDVDSSPQGA